MLTGECNVVAIGNYTIYIRSDHQYMSAINAIRKKKANGLATGLIFVLIAFYAAGAAQLQVLHEYLHAHLHVTSHSETEERDACHRTIYHQDKENGCGHQSHIVVTDKCPLCDLISDTDQVFLLQASSLSVDFILIDFPISVSALETSIHIIRSPRAPPSV